MSDHRAKVRMYRHGLGDCLLVRLPREGKPDYRILIDCGVILGTPDAGAKVQKAVDDIVRETDGEIDLLVATHAHWDHVSGFLQARASFEKDLKIQKVWMAWTEDPADDFAQSLLRQRAKTQEVARAASTALRLAASGGGDEMAGQIDGLLGFFGAGGRNTTDGAMDFLRELGGKGELTYVRPGDAPYRPEGTGARIFVLGPPRDARLIRKSLPARDSGETYEMTHQAMMGQLGLSGEPGPIAGDEGAGRPFTSLYSIPLGDARAMPFFREHYWGGAVTGQDWRRIDDVWMGSAVELALKLDSDTNNTSLVLAIELDGPSIAGSAGGRDVLLFAADAQIGNWESWGTVKWDAPEGEEPVGGLDLVKRTIVYKVGHHGSHNATLKGYLESMERLLVALNPVDEVMAHKKGWAHIPLPSLQEALKGKAREGLVRADTSGQTGPHLQENPGFYEVTV
ncbi:MAG: hypothetical protein JWR84_3115 [Caulobacter sp.]|nr:hypothetical protein [Caulobacter sp.]